MMARIVIPNGFPPSPDVSKLSRCVRFRQTSAVPKTRSRKTTAAPEASAVSWPPLRLGLLPGGANQFPGGFTPAVNQHLSRRTRFCGLTCKF